MKQIYTILVIILFPIILGSWIATNESVAAAQNEPWNINITEIPSDIVETLSMRHMCYEIVQFKIEQNGNYNVLLKGSEDSLYVIISPKGVVLAEGGATILST